MFNINTYAIKCSFGLIPGSEYTAQDSQDGTHSTGLWKQMFNPSVAFVATHSIRYKPETVSGSGSPQIDVVATPTFLFCILLAMKYLLIYTGGNQQTL